MTAGPNGRWRRGILRCVSATAAALLLAGSLAACGPADSGLKQDTAAQLQQRVLTVSQAAAGNDPTGALNALAALEADLAAATDNGTVSDDRRRSIVTAVAAVRADLNEAVAAAAAAAKAAEDAAAAQRQAEADAAAKEANNAAPAPVAPAPAPAPAPAENNGKAGKGKGKDG
jgi:septal ring factor EnvC (AmiA/AmiB activator)